MVDKKFGRLTVVCRSVFSPQYKTYWDCRCDCGGAISVRKDHLVSGKIRSCGCFRNETTIIRTRTHGQRATIPTAEYTAWRAMLQRCYNPNYAKFERYGGRGITVCARWRNSFKNFFLDMGLKPSPNHTLDRENNDRGYSKRNCKWKTVLEQGRNKSSNRWIKFGKHKMTITEWSRYFGVNISTLHGHLKVRSIREIIIYYKNKKAA